jgi:hypothetical protein
MKSEEILQVVKERYSKAAQTSGAGGRFSLLSERSPAWRRVCSTTRSLHSGRFGICPGTRCQAFERLW